MALNAQASVGKWEEPNLIWSKWNDDETIRVALYDMGVDWTDRYVLKVCGKIRWYGDDWTEAAHVYHCTEK